MNPYMTYAEMKAFAKKQMKPVTGNLVGATAILLVFSIMIQVPSSRVQLLFIKSPILRYVLGYLILILANTLRGMLQIGFSNLSLKVCCGRSISISDIFYAFSHQTKNSLLLSAFTSLIVVIPMMPHNILKDWLYPFGIIPPMPHFLTYIPCLILITMLRLFYSQAFFLMLDFPSSSATRLLKNSRLLMRGHKKRFFLLQIRLLLLYLIGTICTCLIGSLWFYPFISVVSAKFYLDLVTKQHNS